MGPPPLPKKTTLVKAVLPASTVASPAASTSTVQTASTVAKPATPLPATPSKRVHSGSFPDTDATDGDAAPFRMVERKKRKPKKRTKKAIPAAGAASPPMRNAFAALTDSEVHPMDTESGTDSDATTAGNKSPTRKSTPVRAVRVPAIVFKRVKAHIATINDLDKLCAKSYELKVAGPEFYRLKLTCPNDYRAVTDAFETRKSAFHTYNVTRTASQRFIVRGLPTQVDTTAIADELESLGFKATAVVQLYRMNGTTKIEYPLYAVTLAPTPGKPPKDISVITRILRCVVSTEAPRTTRGPAQCHRCQRTGHAMAFCHQEPRCVRCAGNHVVADCPTPRGTIEPKCCNCADGAHPASYRGCAYLVRAKQASQPRTQAPKPSRQPLMPVAQKPGPTPTSPAQAPNAWPRLRQTMRPRLEMPAGLLAENSNSTPSAIQGSPPPFIPTKNMSAVQGTSHNDAIQGENPQKIQNNIDPSLIQIFISIQTAIEQSNKTLALLSQTLTAFLSASINQNACTP